ncbi:MAG TPA: molecular chaperone DnaJ [Candidatus Pelagibacter bacterium]|jgi:hypothetical protein|nr:molecular chaperone DnaJ [Pelagibacteraceae bacterium]HJN83964.1 molecular chaperone DnaJ [Candidatus Pelagibacter bacterium]|tara:strand:+ start:370 stop:879 length:510 start_codon:yes stop_codon:yes gene_type:complete
MNIFLVTLIIFVLVYLLLNWFAKTSSKKISKGIRSIIIILAAILALVMVYAGRFIFSLPFVLMILPLIKTKAGLSLFQLLRIWSLLRVLKNSGRFNFNNINQNLNMQSISIEEAYRILNLDPKKKYTKDEVLNSYKKIMKKIHPDISPELTRLAAIVNEAKEVVLKNLI